jgi:predicted regulator of Ras-like GTPase activity (Roadblock/LC7/MglB family)
MSFWSGLAAAGIAIALAFVAFGQPVWEYENVDTQVHETWTYGPFVASQTVVNLTTGVTTFRNYSYDQLAGLPPGRAQPHVAKVFGDYQQLMILALIASAAGVVLGALSRWKKLRGIFAGVSFLAPSALVLYAVFTIAFAIPDAARADVSNSIRQFSGTVTGGSIAEAWNPLIGWYLPIGCGLGFAWASSDFWHLRAPRKAIPKPTGVPVKPSTVALSQPLPPPPVEDVSVVPPEPQIEEVFVIGSNGLLIKHMSRSLMTDKDRDVVGSMISAISSFVREAFTERDGEVHEVSLGDHRFVMCNEAGLVVAVLVTSGETEDIVHRLRHLLAVLRDRYGERLARWQGEPIEGIEDELGALWDPYHLPPPPAA